MLTLIQIIIAFIGLAQAKPVPHHNVRGTPLLSLSSSGEELVTEYSFYRTSEGSLTMTKSENGQIAAEAGISVTDFKNAYQRFSALEKYGSSRQPGNCRQLTKVSREAVPDFYICFGEKGNSPASLSAIIFDLNVLLAGGYEQ
jgi:hypothetical protein